MYLYPGVYLLVGDPQEIAVWKQRACWLAAQGGGGSSVWEHPAPVEGPWSHTVGAADQLLLTLHKEMASLQIWSIGKSNIYFNVSAETQH